MTDSEILARAMDLLGEHYDVVQIFVQAEEDARTSAFNIGKGNLLARQKQVENWLDDQLEHEQI